MKKFLIILIALFMAISPVYAKKQTINQDKTIEYLNLDWWGRFEDENLNENLITVYQNNYDLKNTALKIKENENLVKIQFAQELPALSFLGDLNRDLQAPRQQFGSMVIPKYSQYNYNLPLTASYEIDIWGQNRFKTKSIEQQLEIIKQAQRATYISLTCDFAIDYFNLIKADKMLEIQQDLIKTQEKILSMTQEKYKIGLCDINEVLLQEKYLTILKEEKNRHDTVKKLLEESLKTYLADSKEEVKRNDYEKIKILADIPDEYSSLIIENRPDFKEQEANIKKIGFDIKVAKREFLPKFTILGQIGFNAYHIGSLFNSASQFLNLGIIPSFDLFSGGRKLAFLKLKKYQYEQALNDYQKTILTSAKEINSALIEYKDTYENLTQTQNRLKTQNKIYSLALDKNKIGASSYLDTLYSKEAYSLVLKEEVSNKINLIISAIGLYKAVGGVDLYNLNSQNL